MSPRFRRLVVLIAIALCGAAHTLSAQTPTATTLSILSGGAPVTSVPAGTVITMSAAVSGGNAPITSGTVYFCDSVVRNCMLSPTGTAQVVNGTATYKTALGPGSYSFTAIYVASAGFSGSTSPASTLSMTATSPVTFNATATSTAVGTYNFSATLGTQSLSSPTGTITITDTTIGSTLATLPLSPRNSLSYNLTSLSEPAGDSRGACTVVTGDFNNDGHPDIAVGSGCKSADGLNSSAALQILLGNGDGTFTAGPAIPAAMANTNVTALTVGDFNNDGTLDLIAADNQASGGGTVFTPHLYLLANDGAANFTASQVGLSCTTPVLVTSDLNHDGNLDFATPCNGSLNVFLGNGAGTFTQANTGIVTAPSVGIVTPNPQNAFAIADFNNDGFPDVVYIGSTIAGASLALNTGNGKDFTAGTTTLIPWLDAVIAGDFNGDGNADFIAIAQTEQERFPHGTYIHYLFGDGNGGFGPDQSSNYYQNYGYAGTSIATTDLDHTGLSSVVGFFPTYLYLNFSQVLNYLTASGNTSVLTSAIADFNGDGIQDFVIGDSGLGSTHVYTTGGQAGAAASLSPMYVTGTGTHDVTVAYSGDTVYPAATKQLSLAASPVSTQLFVATPPDPHVVGTPLPLTAILRPYNTGNVSTDGQTVTFTSGSTTLGTATLTNGSAVLTLSNLPLGQTTITASYAGDSTFNASTSSPLVVTIVTPPPPVVNPTSIDFGTIPFSGTATHTVTVTNTAPVALSLASIQTSAGFTQTNTCGSTLAVSASCTVTVTFAPTTLATSNGTLTITTDASTPTTTVSLTGVANIYLTPQITASPNPAPTGSTVTLTVSVPPTTVGNYTTTGKTVTFYTVSTTEIEIGTGTVSADGTATLNVTVPLAGQHLYAAAFEGGSGFPRTTSTLVTVNWADFTPPSTSTAAINLGTVGIGSSVTQTVTLHNTAPFQLNIASIQATGGFTQTNNCGSSLAIAASCTATVTFAPTTAGAHVGTLTFTTNAATPTTTVSLSGTGIAPTLGLVATPTSAPLGTPVTLTATLTPYSSGSLSTNGKIVSFTSGGTTLGTGTLNNGVATLSLTNLPLGSNSITATFTGDADFAAVSSSAATVSITAPPAPTVSPTTISFGTLRLNTPTTQTVSLANTSTGPLTIASIVASSGFTQTNTCGSSVAAGASCAITVSFTATSATAVTGTLAITTNASAPITTVSLSGSGIASALYLTASPASVSLGTQVALSATLTPYTNGSISTNGKTVTFTSGGSVLGTATLNNGTAVFNTSTLPVGNSTITATFTGDANFTSATSNSTTVTVAGLATTLHLAASPTSASLGNQVALTATLTPYSSGSLTTNGKTVTFFKGSTSLGTATWNNGTAVLNLTNLALGSNSITATFTGDTNFASASSSAAVVTITGPTAPTVNPTSVNFGAISIGSSGSQTVTLTNTAASPLTISAVTTSDGFTQTNTCGVLAVSASCTATVTFAPTAANTYNGTLTFTTNAVTPTTTVALSGSGVASVTTSTGGSSNLGTIKSGSTGSLPITFAIAPGVSGTLTTSCSVKLTNGGTATTPPTCSTSPSTFTVTGGNTINTTLTITTTGSTAALRMPTSGIALAGGLIGLLAFLRRKPTFASLLLLLLSLSAISSITGCGTSGGSSSSNSGGGSSSNGGGGSSSNGGGSATNSTTPGTYTVTVTGTIGTQTSSVNLPLTIQ